MYSCVYNLIKQAIKISISLINFVSGIAVRHSNMSVMSKALTLWNMRWQRNQQIAEFVDLIEHKGDLSRKRRILIHWKFCM